MKAVKVGQSEGGVMERDWKTDRRFYNQVIEIIQEETTAIWDEAKSAVEDQVEELLEGLSDRKIKLLFNIITWLDHTNMQQFSEREYMALEAGWRLGRGNRFSIMQLIGDHQGEIREVARKHRATEFQAYSPEGKETPEECLELIWHTVGGDALIDSRKEQEENNVVSIDKGEE